MLRNKTSLALQLEFRVKISNLKIVSSMTDLTSFYFSLIDKEVFAFVYKVVEW